MRVILVPTAARPECAFALDVAFRLAQELDANVTACHVRAERRERRIVTAPATADTTAEVETGDALTSTAAHELFGRAAAKNGFQLTHRPRLGRRSVAVWHDMIGTPERVFGIIGPVADLAVVSRPKARGTGRARTFLLAALLHSAKPVLVVPQRRLTTVGRRILIAWNQSTDAALTVAAALPLLQRAERVVVATSGSENRPGPKSGYLAQYLAQWGVAVERLRTKGRAVERELEDTYHRVDADLLVMGAYSRPRFREFVFGGVTEHMLFRTEIPALMLHR
jgi:nucleotide-binding universal stress UspA family protein